MTGNEGQVVYLTKRIRIPRNAIIGVRRSQFGRQAVIETDRGLTTVMESYEQVRTMIYGAQSEDGIRNDAR